MRRSLYPDGVLVQQPNLEFTEDSKSEQILVSRTNTWESGIYAGLAVTVNSVNLDRVDLATGSGYAPNGELVVVGSAQLNQSLADTTLGASNLAFVFYTELLTDPEPHETNGLTYPTKAEASFRFRILTPAQFAALPATDPTMTNDAQDRALLVARITATGGNLVQGNIENSVPWRDLKFATVASPGINGVSIRNVSDTTPEGLNGQLIFSVSPNRLQWKAPGEVGPGVAVNVPNEADYTLTALGGSTIVVHVIPSALPIAALTVTVAITGVYSQSVPRMSAADRHHRSLVGTGIPTKTNPHGLSIKDIDPDFVSELTIHQELMHAAGIWRGSSPACLRTDIVEVPGTDYLSIIAPTGDDTYWCEGIRLTSVQNNQVTFTDATPGPTREVFEIFVDDAGIVGKSKRSSFPLVSLLTGVENGLVFLSPSIQAGTYALSWTSNGPGLGGSLKWGTGKPTLVPAGVSSGLFSLFDGEDEVKFFISNVALLPQPAGIYTDNITVNAAVSRDRFVVTAQVFWTGSGTGSLGYTPNRGFVPAKLIDQRLFGNLTAADIRDDALEDVFYKATYEKSCDGVLLGTIDAASVDGSLSPTPAGGLFVDINGYAPVYVRGKRMVVRGAQVAVPNNALSVIYVDVDGNLQVTDLQTAAFLNNGNEVLQLNAEAFVQHGAALAFVGTAGGTILFTVDLRRNLGGGNEAVEPWTVGIAERPGLFTRGAEFFDLSGALLYAAAAGQTALRVLTTRVKNPVIIGPGSMSISDGTILVDNSAVNGSTSLFALTGGVSVTAPGSQLVLRNVKVLPGTGVVNALTCYLVTTAAFTSTVLTGLLVKLDQFGGLIRNAGPNSFGTILENVRCELTTAYSDLILQQVPGQISISGLDLTASTALGTVAVVNASTTLAFTSIAQVRGTGQKLVSGAGSITNLSCTNCSGVRLGSMTSVISDVLFDHCNFVDTTPGSVVNAASVRVQFRGCQFGNSVTLLTASDVWFDSCVFVNQLSLANLCSGVRISNCKGTDVVQTSTLYQVLSLLLEGTTLNGTLNLVGTTNKFIKISKCSIQTLQGTYDELGVDNSSITTVEPGTTNNFSNAKFSQCTIGRAGLQWTSGSRFAIEFEGCTFTALVTNKVAAFEVGGATLSRPTLGLKLINCIMPGGPAQVTAVYIDNCSDVLIQGSTFNDQRITAAGGPVINVGLGFASNPAHTYADVKIDGNTFDVTSNDAGPGIADFGNWLVLFSTHTSDPGLSYPGGSKFSNNTVICREPAFNKLLCVLHVGTTRGFQCRNNNLAYLGANANVNWASPAGGGAQSQAARGALSPIPAYPLALIYGLNTYPGAVVGNLGNMNTTQISGNAVANLGAASRWVCAAISAGANLNEHSNAVGPYFDFSVIGQPDRQINN
jgi:hypothetical protein